MAISCSSADLKGKQKEGAWKIKYLKGKGVCVGISEMAENPSSILGTFLVKRESPSLPNMKKNKTTKVPVMINMKTLKGNFGGSQ